MSCEEISESELPSEFAIGYLRSVLPEPRGCSLESESAEHELGSYPVIRLCADPSFGWDGPPMEYVCAYQDLLTVFERAVDWSLITDVLGAEGEDEDGGTDQMTPPHERALIRTSDAPGVELEPEWRRFLQRFPGAVEWEKIEPSAVAELIRSHLEPEVEDDDADESEDAAGVMVAGMPLDEYLRRADRMMSEEWIPNLPPFPQTHSEGQYGTPQMPLGNSQARSKPSPLDGLSRMGRLYAESLRANAPGVWEELEEKGELAERLARNDEEIQQNFQTILAHLAKHHGLDPDDPLQPDRLKVLAGMAREQTMDCWLVKDEETMAAELDGFVDPPEDEEDEEDDADTTLDRVPALTPLQPAPMMYPKPDRSTYSPNRKKTPENDQLDVGWNEGFLSDGRPYRIECWAQDQTTNVTVFLSTAGLENYSNAQFVELLERERVVWWLKGATKSAYAIPFTDSAGNSMWSINIVIGIDYEPGVADTVGIRPYA